MALQTRTEHRGTLAEMLEYLRGMADAEAKGRKGDAAARYRADGMRRAVAELERWTPVPDAPPSLGGYQPGPRADGADEPWRRGEVPPAG